MSQQHSQQLYRHIYLICKEESNVQAHYEALYSMLMLISIELANEEVVVDLIRLVLAVQVGRWEAGCAAGAQGWCWVGQDAPSPASYPALSPPDVISPDVGYTWEEATEELKGEGFILELGSLSKGGVSSSPALGFFCHSGIRSALAGVDPSQLASFCNAPAPAPKAGMFAGRWCWEVDGDPPRDLACPRLTALCLCCRRWPRSTKTT